MPDRLLNVHPETSGRLGLGKTKTTELVLSGTILSVKVGRRRLVPESAVDAYIEAEVEKQNRRRLKAI